MHFREAEAARAVSMMARLAAALVVDFTRIPSSIDVRTVVADACCALNESRNFSFSKCSRAIGRMASWHATHAMQYEDGSAAETPAHADDRNRPRAV
ncbi:MULTISPECIES: hypothetical protein [unclassified Variovorax]|jgi:hypothetical protein|uniref:hypothetical protein n=1 Tax=unclassified Variovorax TaxID=663243 RepID=UPI000F7E8CA1|nr:MULTISPECIES: hypothetical protein [unclassified Variovorax]